MFRHESLPEGPWIRLMRLLPGTRDAHIRCNIFHKRLDDVAGEYDALSYTWGSTMNMIVIPRSIYINNQLFIIGENLFDFLVELRSSEESVILWADAICIDQNDLNEKNHQVQQMSNVYRNSRLTRIWLGKRDSLHWKTLEDARRVCDSVRTMPNWQLGAPQISNNLNAMIYADYWSRLWIVQEVLLSSDIQIHISGLVCNYEEFVPFCKEYQSWLWNSAMYTIYQQKRHRKDRSLPELIRAYQSSLCSDPRDRVFGLLGLFDDFVIEVDYRVSRIALFQMVLQKYPAQFADVLARRLAAALEVSQEYVPTTLQLPEIVLKAKECGVLIEGRHGLTWDHSPERSLHFTVYDEMSPLAGDRVVSLLGNFKSLTSAEAFYILIVRRHQDPSVGFDVYGRRKSVRFEIIGSATARNKRRVAEAPQKPTKSQVRIVRVDQPSALCEHETMLIRMTIEDFLAIEAAGGFPEVLKKEEEFERVSQRWHHAGLNATARSRRSAMAMSRSIAR